MWPWSDSEFRQSGSGLGFDSSCAPRPPPHPPPDPRAGAPGPRKPGICGEPVWPFQRSLISRLFSLSFQMVPWFPQASRGARSPLASGQFSPPPPTAPRSLRIRMHPHRQIKPVPWNSKSWGFHSQPRCSKTPRTTTVEWGWEMGAAPGHTPPPFSPEVLEASHG